MVNAICILHPNPTCSRQLGKIPSGIPHDQRWLQPTSRVSIRKQIFDLANMVVTISVGRTSNPVAREMRNADRPQKIHIISAFSAELKETFLGRWHTTQNFSITTINAFDCVAENFLLDVRLHQIDDRSTSISRSSTRRTFQMAENESSTCITS